MVRTEFEEVKLQGNALSNMDLTPFWLTETPSIDEDDPFWGKPGNTEGWGEALFVSGPSRNGNHLVHSMLDGHPEIGKVPGEDSFLAAYFQDLFEDREMALERIRSEKNVEYILQLTGWGINKWKELWILNRQGGKSSVWSGIQPEGEGFVTDYQDTVIPIDYWAYERKLRQRADEIRTAKTLVEIVWIYMDALSQLATNPHGGTYPYCWVGSGMRRELGFLMPRIAAMVCVAPLRRFDSYYFSFAKGRYQTSSVKKHVLKDAWQHWLHKTIDYLLLKKRYGERVILVNFDDIIKSPEQTAFNLCHALKIPFDPCLLIPTSLGNPTKGNSSFAQSEEVRGTFYKDSLKRNLLEPNNVPPQFSAIWKIVESVTL